MSIPIFPNSSAPNHPLKGILWAIFLCSIGASALQAFGLPVVEWMTLSTNTLAKGYFWTFLSYPFIVSGTSSFDLFFRLIFDLLFLWIFGSALLMRLGSKRFLSLFFGLSVCAALAALPIILTANNLQSLSGPGPVLIGMITAWIILNSEQNVQYAASFTFKPFWIFLFLVLLNILFDLLDQRWIFITAKIGAGLFGYFFCLISEKVPSRVRLLWPFERNILRLLDKTHPHKKPKTSKIVDFQTGQPILTDDQFVDAMLARISLYGENTLTPDEKNRMRQISERKSLKKR